MAGEKSGWEEWKDLNVQILDAKKAGYSDEEIAQYLQGMPTVGPQVTTALENNYAAPEIVKSILERKSPSYEQGAQKSTAEKAVLTALQGPTLGYFDELAGAVAAPLLAYQQNIPLGQAYQQQRDVVRGATESFTQDRPFTSAGLQGIASVPLAMSTLTSRAIGAASAPVVSAIEGVAPKVAAGMQSAGQYLAGAPAAGQTMGMGQRMAQAGAAGVGYGLIGGAGSSTGENTGQIAEDALKSAAIGGILGPVTQPVMGIVGAGGRQIAARVSDAAASRYGQQKVAEALLRDTPPDLLQSALTMSQARMGKLGPEARIADIGGANVRGLLDTLATLPGETKQALERAIRERQAGRAGRMMTAADEALGTQGAQFQQSLDAFNTMRKTQAQPFYDAIKDASVTVDDNLLTLLQKSKDLQGGAETLFRRQTGQEINLGNLKKGDVVPMTVLDSVKQSLYDAAQTAKQSGSGNQAKAIDDIRVNLTRFLVDKSPKLGGQSAYRQALDKWAGPSQMMDAAELGRKAMTGDIVNFKQELSTLSGSEIDAFRIGALQSLRQKTGTESGQTSLLKMWKEPATQERLKAVFENDYRKFSTAVAQEARLKGLESAGRGSQTASRLAGMTDLDIAPAMAAGQSVMSGNVPGMITSAVGLANRISTPEPVRNQMGQILLSRDQQRLNDLMMELRRQGEARSRAAGLGGFTGGAIGSNVQPYTAGLLGN
ncbi:hypothetical protein UFOVP189_48 [uncultured Caudovirales phage]|uniref:Uncharacterized protein n=1 Tax=uncultured Caudovirales phage TaxID=2100421 RepID=A0A6J7WIZ3_9CAUD|nr:hypothetical protein UFOVP189_48 [uncultured Caudovirales phage]